jgi:hypothetical protein
MGAGPSKDTTIVAPQQAQSTMPTIDPTAFSYVPESIVKASQAQLQAAQQAAEQGRMAAESAAEEAARKAGLYWSVIKGIMYFLLAAVVIIVGLYLIDYLTMKYSGKGIIGLPGINTMNDATQRQDLNTPTTPPKTTTTPTTTTTPSTTTTTPTTTTTTTTGGTKDKFTNYEGLENPGGFGISWWMFIKDWNYGYGKEKTVLTVSGTKVTLHPTDNSLKVTVPLFGNEQSANGEPVPATDMESSESVYTCEVHDIPLQTWIPVSISIFGRNLDVYVDGKLVKSCFLPGVPKLLSGEVVLSPDGGFSGFTCDVKKVDTMLTSQDVMAYAAAGNSCRNNIGPKGEPVSAIGSATGYSVKFGIYDTIGKKIKEYVF